jgi:hypothetical protein
MTARAALLIFKNVRVNPSLPALILFSFFAYDARYAAFVFRKIRTYPHI